MSINSWVPSSSRFPVTSSSTTRSIISDDISVTTYWNAVEKIGKEDSNLELGLEFLSGKKILDIKDAPPRVKRAIEKRISQEKQEGTQNGTPNKQ